MIWFAINSRTHLSHIEKLAVRKRTHLCFRKCKIFKSSNAFKALLECFDKVLNIFECHLDTITSDLSARVHKNIEASCRTSQVLFPDSVIQRDPNISVLKIYRHWFLFMCRTHDYLKKTRQYGIWKYLIIIIHQSIQVDCFKCIKTFIFLHFLKLDVSFLMANLSVFDAR